MMNIKILKEFKAYLVDLFDGDDDLINEHMQSLELLKEYIESKEEE